MPWPDFEPHVTTLAMDLPGFDGLEALDRIMLRQPTPVVLVTGVGRGRADRTLQALEKGAIDFVLKYVPGQENSPAELGRQIVAKVRLAASVKVIRRLAPTFVPKERLRATMPRRRDAGEMQLIVIGASTGGPQALKELLGELPFDFPAAIVIVQHLPGSFTTALAETLNRVSGITVREARDGERLRPGVAFVAPGSQHLHFRPDERLELTDDEPHHGYRPSIDVTMTSAVRVFGERVTGVILSGMGDDGVRGLAEIRTVGGVTLAQDAASSVVYGMPRRAAEAGLVECFGNPTQIAQMLVERVTIDIGSGRSW
jgi:two-component system, chemotaxis family, protein-glutamate methylesterase/glutaminase